MNHFYRTHATDLSDAELILLDVLFDCGTSTRLLRDETFHSQWNLPSSHGLDDDRLSATLKRWGAEGIVEYRRDFDGDGISITSLGGFLWEQERLPQWNRYVAICSGGTDRPDLNIWSIVAVAECVIDDFIRAGEGLNLWGNRGTRFRRVGLRRHYLLPWKKLSLYHTLVIAVRDVRPNPWGAESRRLHHSEKLEYLFDGSCLYWSDVRELQKFVP